jgi:hypothetical protein
MQHPLLLVAAGALALLGIMHSYLGERFVISRILALPNLPTLRGSQAYMSSILRWAWHLTSVAWWGTAGVLFSTWMGGRLPAVGAVLAVTFALHGVIILVKTSPRHPAWPLFFLTAAAIWFGTR